MTAMNPETTYDAVIIGSGFGGSMVAHQLVGAGWRVLMIERGGWVPRGPENWADRAVGPMTPYYSTETPYRAVEGGEGDVVGSFNCVGGPSVFYGGASLRFRAQDFEPCPEIVGDSDAAWPYRYADVEPHYARAEQLLGVAGQLGADPTEPFHSTRYPQMPGALSPTARRMWDAARRLGLHPSRLPLAFNHGAGRGRVPCAACNTCDGFACAIGAKNDLATAVIPGLVHRGLRLEANTVAVRLVTEGRRLTAVDCVNRQSGRPVRYSGRLFVLSAGALASPHLILASGLDRGNPGGHNVGRYLMRHWNAVVIGAFPRRPDPEAQFHKQVAIHDFYFGHPSVAEPTGKLGAIQQLATPPRELVKAHLPKLVGGLVAEALPHATGLLVMAEDQPRFENGVELDPARAGSEQNGRIHRSAVVADFQIMPLQDRRIGTEESEKAAAARAQVGCNLLQLDAVGHTPLRVEHDVLHIGGEQRRLVLDLADHDLGRMHDLAILQNQRRHEITTAIIIPLYPT
jgi:hypothetical protein